MNFKIDLCHTEAKLKQQKKLIFFFNKEAETIEKEENKTS